MKQTNFLVFSALTFSALLSGCVGLPGILGASVKAYDGPERNDSEVATLVRSTTRGAGMAFVRAVDDIEYGDDRFSGWPSAVKVLPGSHKISLNCHFQMRYGYPSLQAELKAGRTYEVVCEGLENEYARAIIFEVETGK